MVKFWNNCISEWESWLTLHKWGGSRSFMTMTMTIWWPKSGVWIYQIVTGVASVVGMPWTHLVLYEGNTRALCTGNRINATYEQIASWVGARFWIHDLWIPYTFATHSSGQHANHSVMTHPSKNRWAPAEPYLTQTTACKLIRTVRVTTKLLTPGTIDSQYILAIYDTMVHNNDNDKTSVKFALTNDTPFVSYTKKNDRDILRAHSTGIYPNSKVHGASWGPSGADRTQVGPMLAPLTLLSGSISLECMEKTWEHVSHPIGDSCSLNHFFHHL